MKKIYDSTYFLKVIKEDILIASEYFKEYLISHDKDTWDEYLWKSLSWISYSQIIDRNLMPKKTFNTLRKLKTKLKNHYKYSDFNPNKHNPVAARKTLEILEIASKEADILLQIEIKRMARKKKSKSKAPLNKVAS